MNPTAADAVRNYLLFLQDPAQLVDPDRIEALEAAVAAQTDVLAKLRAVGELHRAKALDEGVYRAGYIQHAKTFAATEDIPASAFAEFGVPSEVLISAGLRPAPKPARPAKPKRVAGRAKTVPTSEITAWILQQKTLFTTVDVAAGPGGSITNITRIINNLVAANQIINHGPDPDYQGRGRGAFRYETSPSQTPRPVSTRRRKSNGEASIA